MTESAFNMKLLAQDELGGFGNIGEGMSLQLAKGGRRILWLAHESAPKNFTAVDVSDPRHPRVILQTDLPHRQGPAHSLAICGDAMAGAPPNPAVRKTPPGDAHLRHRQTA